MKSIVATVFVVSLFLGTVLLGYYNILLLSTVKVVLAGLFLIFVIIPIIFKHVYVLQKSMVFLNFVQWPRNVNFNTPDKYNIFGARNFYISASEDVKLGVWHVLPYILLNNSQIYDDTTFEGSLNHGEPVILYMHGNSGSRASSHRVELYQVLQKLNYHVIAFDYRSYADSSPVEPTEDGLVADGKFIFSWLKERVKSAPIFVWGHSLGTGVSSHALRILYDEGNYADGLILESPFNNLRDEIKSHPFSKIFNSLPWFEYFFVDPVGSNGIKFESDKHLEHVKCPILILHAVDDVVVPFALGKKLYYTIMQNRSVDSEPVELVRFEAKFKYGHKYICRSPELPGIIQQFVTRSIQTKRS